MKLTLHWSTSCADTMPGAGRLMRSTARLICRIPRLDPVSGYMRCINSALDTSGVKLLVMGPALRLILKVQEAEGRRHAAQD